MWNVPNVIVQLFRLFFRLGRNILAITKLPSDHTRSRRSIAKSIGDSSEPVGLVFWHQSDKIVSLTLFLKSNGNYFCTEFRLLSNFWKLFAGRKNHLATWHLQRFHCLVYQLIFEKVYISWEVFKIIQNWCIFQKSSIGVFEIAKGLNSDELDQKGLRWNVVVNLASKSKYCYNFCLIF